MKDIIYKTEVEHQQEELEKKKTIELVDLATRRHLVLLLYSVFEDIKIGYGMMHKAAKCMQDMLETKYGRTLGYKFKDPSIYDIWDNKFQLDIEKYSALGFLVINDNVLIAKNYYGHNLKLSSDGKLMLKTIATWNLEKKFQSYERLKNELISSCMIK